MSGPSSPEIPQGMTVPVVGVVSISGRSRVMEDAFCIRPNLCRPEINRRQPLHYFAVFDGHGGAHVASLCRERMHALLEEELMRVGNDLGGSSSGAANVEQPPPPPPEPALKEAWITALRNCFRRMDTIAVNTCGACGNMENQCGCNRYRAGLTGSTAVVVVMTDQHIIVANCGDSRAVLGRRGRPFPLSHDHKPNRADELARIEVLGGRVINTDVARVGGILAMSRAIGDGFLKPSVTAEPEITFTRRGPEDELLVMASDGLWDVMPNQMVYEVTRECLRENSPPPNEFVENEEARTTFFPSRSASAATLLTSLAMGRNSGDNITVIVIDLKRNEEARFIS